MDCDQPCTAVRPQALAVAARHLTSVRSFFSPILEPLPVIFRVAGYPLPLPKLVLGHHGFFATPCVIVSCLRMCSAD